MPCKISSVLCVIEHISTQSAVSLSASKSFQGAEEFTQSPDLSVGGIGNCKDKSLQQLKSGFLFSRAFGISQISQIQPCPPLLSETWPCPLPASKRKMEIWGVCVGENLAGQGVRCLTDLFNELKPLSSIMCHFLPLICSYMELFLLWATFHCCPEKNKQTCMSNFNLLLNLLGKLRDELVLLCLEKILLILTFPPFVPENVHFRDAWFPGEECFANISTDFLFHLSLYE